MRAALLFLFATISTTPLASEASVAEGCPSALLPEHTTAQFSALRTQAEDPAATEGERMERLGEVQAMLAALDSAGITLEGHAVDTGAAVAAPQTAPAQHTVPMDIPVLTQHVNANDLVSSAMSNGAVRNRRGAPHTYTQLIVAILDAYSNNRIDTTQRDAWVDAAFYQMENHRATRALGAPTFDLVTPRRDRNHNGEDFVEGMMTLGATEDQLARALTSPALPPLTPRQMSRMLIRALCVGKRDYFSTFRRVAPNLRVTLTDAQELFERAMAKGHANHIVRLGMVIRPRTLAGTVSRELPKSVSRPHNVTEPTYLHYAARIMEAMAADEMSEKLKLGRDNPSKLEPEYFLTKLQEFAEMMNLPGIDIRVKKANRTALQRVGALVRIMDDDSKKRHSAENYKKAMDLYEELQRR